MFAAIKSLIKTYNFFRYFIETEADRRKATEQRESTITVRQGGKIYIYTLLILYIYIYI